MESVRSFIELRSPKPGWVAGGFWARCELSAFRLGWGERVSILPLGKCCLESESTGWLLSVLLQSLGAVLYVPVLKLGVAIAGSFAAQMKFFLFFLNLLRECQTGLQTSSNCICLVLSTIKH